jgi:hypothetical protein
MVRADSAPDERPGARVRRFERATDQLFSDAPVETHTALCGIHRFGDSEAKIPYVMSECDRALPVDRSVQPRIDVCERICDHMDRSVGNAVEGG